MIKSEKFPWGKVIETIVLNFDGQIMTIVKYHPRIAERCVLTLEIDETKVKYSCEEIGHSADNIFHLVLIYMAIKHLGHNQDALVQGIARALQIPQAGE
jgi:hypothetical protein